jgi:hypothetical protein
MIALWIVQASRDASEQEILRWFQATREVALEVPGVYDFALCDSDEPTVGGLRCVLEVEDEQVLSTFWEDQRVQKALQQGKQKGLELVLQALWRRLA